MSNEFGELRHYDDKESNEKKKTRTHNIHTMVVVVGDDITNKEMNMDRFSSVHKRNSKRNSKQKLCCKSQRNIQSRKREQKRKRAEIWTM